MAGSGTGGRTSGTTAVRAVSSTVTVEQFTAVGTSTAWAWVDGGNMASIMSFPQGIMRTTDAGASWENVTPVGLATAKGNRYISSVYFKGIEDAWVSYGGAADGAAQTLVATKDGGRHWSVIGRPPSPYCEVEFIDVAHGWCVEMGAAAGTDEVVLYRTTNGGRSWKLGSRSASATGAPGKPGSLPSVCEKRLVFISETEGWASFACNAGKVGSVSPLFETTDAGRSWSDASISPLPPGYISENGSPAAWVGSPLFDGSTGAAGLSDDANGHLVSLIYRTIDGGSSWQPVLPPGPPHYWLIDLVDATQWKLVSGHTILSTSNAGRTWQTVNSDRNLGAAPEFVTPEVAWYPGSEAPVEYRTVDCGATWIRIRFPALT